MESVLYTFFLKPGNARWRRCAIPSRSARQSARADSNSGGSADASNPALSPIRAVFSPQIRRASGLRMVLNQPGGESSIGGRRRIDLRAPECHRAFKPQRFIVFLNLKFRRMRAGKRCIQKRALAKAMNGVNRRLIKMIECAF